jgi:vitamin B12 transporter
MKQVRLTRTTQLCAFLAMLVRTQPLAAFEEEAAQEEELVVVVEGSRAPRSASDPEASVGVIEGEPLREPGVDAADILTRIPGVQVTRTGSSADLVTASIRGAEASQVPVYLAGIRLNDDIVGVADLSRIPLWMLQRVEVHRSGTPIRAARGGMGGAILFEPSLPGAQAYRLGAEAGSFATGALWAGGTLNHLSDDPSSKWATSLAVKRSGARNDFRFKSDEGTAFFGGDDRLQVRRNADFSEGDIWVLSRGRVGAGQRAVNVTGLYNHLAREQGVSGISLVPAQSARSALTRDLAGLSARLPCSFGKACALSLASSLSLATLVTSDPEAELSLGVTDTFQRNDRFTQQMQWEVEHSAYLSTSFGVTGESSRLLLNTKGGEEQALTRAREAYFGAVGGLTYSPQHDRFVRVVGRASCMDVSGAELAPAAPEARIAECHPEGQIGAEKQWEEIFRVRALAHRGVRLPTLGERYLVSATTRGNPDLQAEKSFGVDLGATLEDAPSHWVSYFLDVALFDRTTQDLIALRRSALGYVRPFNVGRARFLGAELSGEATAVDHLRSRSTVTLLDPRDRTPDRATANTLIPYRSQITATQEFEVYRENPAQTVSHLGMLGYLTYRSGRVADPAGLIVIPQQLVVDLGARLQFVRQVDVRARLENVFGVARYDALGFPLPGRSAFLSAEIVSP